MMTAPAFALNRVILGDCRETLKQIPDETFQCCVSSPPYWGLRDYGHADQIGLEPTPEEYVSTMVAVFREVRRVLREDATLWLNLGDSYVGSPNSGATGKQDTAYRAIGLPSKRGTGLKPKDLVGIPWLTAFALRADGWYLRSDIVWSKPNPMPESVTDRPTKAHEYVFLLSKSARYFYDADAIKETATYSASGNAERFVADGSRGRPADHLGSSIPWKGESRNVRTVWEIASQPYDGAHFATMPPKLVERCIMAGSRIGDAVLDPFMGSGTVGQVAEALGRRWLGIELNEKYGKLIADRTAQVGLPFARQR